MEGGELECTAGGDGAALIPGPAGLEYLLGGEREVSGGSGVAELGGIGAPVGCDIEGEEAKGGDGLRYVTAGGVAESLDRCGGVEKETAGFCELAFASYLAGMGEGLIETGIVGGADVERRGCRCVEAGRGET